MERNNPYITKIYDYEEYLLPHHLKETEVGKETGYYCQVALRR
jgi:hypothetical protein